MKYFIRKNVSDRPSINLDIHRPSDGSGFIIRHFHKVKGSDCPELVQFYPTPILTHDHGWQTEYSVEDFDELIKGMEFATVQSLKNAWALSQKYVNTTRAQLLSLKGVTL